MDRVRLGVVGLGNMGSAHIKSHLPQLPRIELTAVCDVDPKRTEPYDVAKFERSEEMIRSGLIDALLVCTPHYGHTTIGIDAMSQGLHLLVEKPISVHKADAERLVAAHREGLVFAAMFNQRTDPRYRKVRDLVQSGELGEIRRASWTITDWFRTAAYYASGGWRATWGGEGGGVLLNQCPHNLDLYQWILGMPSRVTAHVGLGRFHDIEVEDQVTAFLEHPNGATAVFTTTTGEAPGTNRLEIAGDRGKVVVEEGKITLFRTRGSVEEFLNTDPGSFSSPEVWRCEVPPAPGGGGQHVEILRNFAESILDGTPLIAPAAEGRNSVELANAMILSGLQKRTVDLPLDAADYEGVLKTLVSESRHQKKVADTGPADLAASYR
jgi:predicted dehydrogenase